MKRIVDKFPGLKSHPHMSRRRRGAQAAQSLVEFAVSLFFILLLLVGIADMTRAFFTYMALRDAAQEGALFGSIDPDNTNGIIDHVRHASDQVRGMEGASDENLSSGDPDIWVEVTYTGTPHCTGKGIKVKVTYNAFPLTMPFLGAVLGRQTIPISATATDTILRPGCT